MPCLYGYGLAIYPMFFLGMGMGISHLSQVYFVPVWLWVWFNHLSHLCLGMVVPFFYCTTQ